MTDKEKIRAEIERRIKEYDSMKWAEDESLLSFIDSLQDEPNAEETELNSLAFLEQLGYTCIPPKESWPPQDKTPTYASTEYKVNVTKGELDYNSPEIKVLVKGPSIEEKSEIPTNLEEEVIKYWNDHALECRLGRVADIDFLNLTARHFAEWQKKQDELEFCYEEAFDNGVKYTKEQMLKEAVEGSVVISYIDRDGVSYCNIVSTDIPAEKYGLEEGSKCKFLILKDDDRTK